MSLKLDLQCSMCPLVLQNPISLPCFCVICEEHLIDGENLKKLIKCERCGDEFNVPKEGFKSNNMVKKILERDGHLNDEEKSLKTTCKVLIYSMTKLVDEFESKQANLEVFCHEHFSEIRRNIDIHRETMKAKIDELAMEMIGKAKKNEETFMNRIKDNFAKKFQVDIENEEKVIAAEFRKQNFVAESVKKLNVEHVNNINKLKYMLQEIESITHQIEKHEFKGNSEFNFDLFGGTNGQKIMSCCDLNIKIWDLESSQNIKILDDHTKGVMCVESLGNNRFISGSLDKTVKVWDARRGVCIQTLIGHKHSVMSLKGLEGNMIASGSNRTIMIWNIVSGNCVHILKGHTDWVSCLALLPNANLASGSHDKSIRIWSTSRGLCMKIINEHTNSINCLHMLENGLLASGSSDNTIKIWNTGTGVSIKTLNGHAFSVRRLESKANGELISCSGDKTIKIWNSNTGVCVKTLKGFNDNILCMKMTQNGTLITGSNEGLIKLWNLEADELSCIKTFQRQNKPVNNLVLL